MLALLCHKDTAQSTQRPQLYLYGIGLPTIDPFCAWKPLTHHAITTHWHFTCLEVCCYGIDLGASIVRFHQSEHSISFDLDQWECSTLPDIAPHTRRASSPACWSRQYRRLLSQTDRTRLLSWWWGTSSTWWWWCWEVLECWSRNSSQCRHQILDLKKIIDSYFFF